MAFRLFEQLNHSEAYFTYRPIYPDEVYEKIANFCKEVDSNGMDFAIDLGCGEGRSTVPLCSYFKKVVGMDVSPTQIKVAVDKRTADHPNVSFRVGAAEDLHFLTDSSVDLVTTATSIHWMDWEKLNKEIKRVLKPGGGFVAYDYKDAELDIKEANDLCTKEYIETVIPSSGLPLERALFNVKCLKSPFEGVRPRFDDVYFNHIWSVDNFMKYWKTVSMNSEMLRQFPDTMLYDNVSARLKEIYRDPTNDQEIPIKLTFHMRMFLVRKPQTIVQRGI